MSTYEFTWRGAFENPELEAVHAEAFGHDPVDYDWNAQVRDHSLGWVVGRDGDALVGFVNVVGDGGSTPANAGLIAL